MQSFKHPQTRASTAKSTISQYSAGRMSNADYYLAEKLAGRVRDDDTLSVADKSTVEKALTQHR